MNRKQLTAMSGVWKPATDLQKLENLILLAHLPMRNPTDMAAAKRAYMLSLEGCTAYGLDQAAKAILRGSLGHPFMPSPPELRIEIERIMDAEREKLMRSSRLEWPEDQDPTEPPDDAAKQRMHARWAAVRPMFEADKPEDPAPSPEPKTVQQRLDDLRDYASQPIEVSATLLRKLAERKRQDEREDG